MRKSRYRIKLGDWVTYDGEGPFKVSFISSHRSYLNLKNQDGQYAVIAASLHRAKKDLFMSDVSDVLNHQQKLQKKEQENKL